MPTATKKDKDTETIRSAQHKELDDVYSKRDPSLGDVEIESVAVTSGNAKAKAVSICGNTIDTSGEVELDREGWLSLAKHASRRAQSV